MASTICLHSILLYDIANYWLSAIFRDLQLITLLVNDNLLAVFDIVDLLSYRLLSG